jgi:hypothetical protein
MTMFRTSDYDVSSTYERIGGKWKKTTSVYVSAGWRRDDDQGSSSIHVEEDIPKERILEIISKEQYGRHIAPIAKPLRPSGKMFKEKKEAAFTAVKAKEKRQEDLIRSICPSHISVQVIGDTCFCKGVTGREMSHVFDSFTFKVKEEGREIQDFWTALKAAEKSVSDFKKREEDRKKIRIERISKILAGESPIAEVGEEKIFMVDGKVTVPDWAMKHLIGRGGSTIKSAESGLGKRIRLTSYKGEKEPYKSRAKWLV